MADAARPVIRVAQVVRPATGGIRRHVSLLLAGLPRSRFAQILFAPADFSPDLSVPIASGTSHAAEPADAAQTSNAAQTLDATQTFDVVQISNATQIFNATQTSEATQTLDAAETFLAGATTPHVPLAIGGRTRPLADLRISLQLARHLRGKVDLVHAHGLRAALIGVLGAYVAGIPAVFTAHNLMPSLPFVSRRMVQFVAQRAACILAVSQAVAETLVTAGISRSKIQLLPNGIDLAPYADLADHQAVRAAHGLADRAPLVVGVGRFAREKGFDTLIEAFLLVRESLPEAALALAGSGPLDAELRHLARSRNIPVVFTGPLANVAPLLGAADVVAVPSRQEGQGIVALEAMAAGKPVVASRVGGLVEIVLQQETGLLVPSADPSALAHALLTLLTDSALRQALGDAGRARVQRDYTAAQMLERIQSVYENCL